MAVVLASAVVSPGVGWEWRLRGKPDARDGDGLGKGVSGGASTQASTRAASLPLRRHMWSCSSGLPPPSLFLHARRKQKAPSGAATRKIANLEGSIAMDVIQCTWQSSIRQLCHLLQSSV